MPGLKGSAYSDCVAARTSMTRWAAIALAFWAMAAGPRAEPNVLQILSHELKFSADELAALDLGAIVKHALPTREPGEIAWSARRSSRRRKRPS